MKIVAQTVMQMVVYGLLMLFSGIAYGLLTVRVLPRRTLKPRCTGRMGDRGIRRARSDGGRAVVYRPAPAFTPFIPQYLLYASRETGLKYLKCEKNPAVRQLSYDVAVFDNRNRLQTVLRVDEETDGTNWTRAVRLPRETAYISLIVRRADGFRCRDARFTLPPAGMIAYVLLTALLGAGEAVFLRLCSRGMIEAWPLIVGQPMFSAGMTAIGGALLGVLTAACILLGQLRKMRKVMNA